MVEKNCDQEKLWNSNIKKKSGQSTKKCLLLKEPSMYRKRENQDIIYYQERDAD